MKKLVLSTLAISVIATGALAGSKITNYVGAKISDYSYDNKPTVFNDDLKNEELASLNTTGIYLSRMFKKDSGLLFGSSSEFYGIGDGKWGVGIDFRLGYAPIEKLSVYGIAGYSMNFLSDYHYNAGFNYGIGATYDINNDFSVFADYKNHSLTLTDSDGNDLGSSDASGLGFGIALSY
jgi:hypothetical protein